MKNEKLQELFVSELKDILNAERQIIAGLPEAIHAAESKELKQGLEKHLKETLVQVDRLEKVFHMINEEPQEVPCEAMQGLIEEVKDSIQEHAKSPLRDAALISKLQRIEHYEISVYGTLRTFAKELGLDKAKKLLEQTLDEESNADKDLTKIAEGGLIFSGVNRKANK